jgi:hypothetical protein
MAVGDNAENISQKTFRLIRTEIHFHKTKKQQRLLVTAFLITAHSW